MTREEIAQLGSAFREFGAGVEAEIAGSPVGNSAADALATAVEDARRVAVQAFVVWLRLRAMRVAVARAKRGEAS